MINKGEFEAATPVERYRRRRRFRYLYWLLFLVFLIAVYLFWKFVPETPDRYDKITDHFKYGSIGSDNTERGLPYWIWKVMPDMFPEYLPDNGLRGYEAFGLIREPGTDRYIGFSKRRVRGIELVGLNCAMCHVSTYRHSSDSQPKLVLGMPAHRVDLQGMFVFFFQCVSDSRFNSDQVLEEIRKQADLGLIDRIVYRRVIEQFRRAVLAQKEKLAYWKELPPAGPGRINTFGPYKALFFNLPAGTANGTADFPSLWNQRMRRGMELHWDGNNISVDERNISASIGAGATPESLDEDALKRVADWILDFKPPTFPRKIDQQLVGIGKDLFASYCYDCHHEQGKQVGTVVPLSELGTDAHRLESFTEQLADQMNTLGTGYPWRFTNFKTTNGYSNSPLDGIWLRAPYLHNGSVPTLRHLLNPDERPDSFFRGNDLYDWENVGFDWDTPSEGRRKYFEFDTTKPGNGNGGHLYGADLEPDQKRALIEYLKTL